MLTFLSDAEDPQMSSLCNVLLTLNITVLAAVPLLISVLSGAKHSFTHAIHYAIFMDAGVGTGMLVMAVASLLLRTFSAARLESVSIEIKELLKLSSPEHLDHLDDLWNQEWPCQWRIALHQATGVTSSVIGLAMLAALIFATLLTL